MVTTAPLEAPAAESEAGASPDDSRFSYVFRIGTPLIYKGTRKTSYRARWYVDSREYRETYDDEDAMNSFIAVLEHAGKTRERFRLDDGRPVGMSAYKTKRARSGSHRREGKPSSARKEAPDNVFDYLRAYVMKRQFGVSGKHRENMAEALMWVMVALLPNGARRPKPELLRRTLRSFAFNGSAPGLPEDEARAMAWVEKHAPPMEALEDDAVLQKVYAQFAVCLDGSPRATESRKRYHHIFNPAIQDAVAQGHLSENRLEQFRRNGRRTRVRQKSDGIDKRVCANIEQFQRLHTVMKTLPRLGLMISTYFAVIFWAALRPEEAAAVRWTNILLPATDSEWGELILDSAAPTVGSKWTLDGKVREHRELKACEIGDTRVVPLCPQIVAILRLHLRIFRKGPNDQVFWGERGDMLSDSTCRSMLKRARTLAFTEEEYLSPVAKTPYDFRHACITRWLNALIPVADVAKWSGNSPAIIHRKYEHCVDAQLHRLQKLIEAADQAFTGARFSPA